MQEPKTYPFYLHLLTDSIFHSWKEHSYVFDCEFCGHLFRPGEKMQLTYTNMGGQVGGNPKTCEQCAGMPYEERVRIWKLINDKKFVLKAVIEQSAREGNE